MWVTNMVISCWTYSKTEQRTATPLSNALSVGWPHDFKRQIDLLGKKIMKKTRKNTDVGFVDLTYGAKL